MKTLTLDLGTHTGWALLDATGIYKSGTIHLATQEELAQQRTEGKERTLDMRFSRLYEFISQQVTEGATTIVFEDVLFSSTQMQGQLWASLRAAIWAVHMVKPVAIFGVPVGTLKSFATGSGSADKPEMARALANREPSKYQLIGDKVFEGDREVDDNEVDALWLGHYAQEVAAGKRDFLSIYQRKQAEKLAKKQRKAARRIAKREAALRKKEALAIKAQQIKEALALAGKCCGVLRVADKRKAVCPKCGNFVQLRIPKNTQHVETVPQAIAA